jgi:hypothetical protein
MLHAISVRPVRVTRYSVPLNVLTRGVVAYRAECSCGARWTARPTVKRARFEAGDHGRLSKSGGGKVDSTHAASPSIPSPIARAAD